MGDEKSTKLAAEAARAVDLLQTLTGEKKAPTGTLAMPAGEVYFGKGVAFLFSTKGGLGVSVSVGSGFLLAKTGDMSWSAPLFFDMKSGGLGISLGYSEVATVIILDDDRAIQDFLGTQATFGGNTSAALGDKLGTDLGETAINLSHINNTYKTFQYSVAKGAIVDISIQGAVLTVSDERNRAHYGDASRQEIINGTAPPPHELGPLYNTLNKLQSQGAAGQS